MSITVPEETPDHPPLVQDPPVSLTGDWRTGFEPDDAGADPANCTWQVMTGYTPKDDPPPRTAASGNYPTLQEALDDAKAKWAAGARDLCIEATDAEGDTWLAYIPSDDPTPDAPLDPTEYHLFRLAGTGEGNSRVQWD